MTRRETTPKSHILHQRRSCAPIFDRLGVNAAVCGHVHMQFDRRLGATRVVNAGSVAMPFDAPGAYWLLLDSVIELRRTDYELEKAAELPRSR